MNDPDRQAIDDLFKRLAEVERAAPPRDAEAEALIRRRIAESPGAAYHMAQTVVAQDAALQEAERRLEALEREHAQARSGGGGFLSGLFGAEAPRSPARRGPPAAPAPAGRQGGFLAGAAQTAIGVTGGVLLAQALTGGLTGGVSDPGGDGLHAAGGAEDGLDDGGGWDDFDI